MTNSPTEPSPPAANAPRRRPVVPYVVLAVSLLVTAAVARYVSTEAAANDRAYVERLGLPDRFKGIQGIGVSLRIPAVHKDQVLRELRRQPELKDFDITPPDPRPEYHAIVYLEPLDARNRRAIGYDMFTEPTRRAAMERARDEGSPAASGKVDLVQENDANRQAGFLIYLPVYDTHETPNSVEERRARLRGF